MSGSEPTLDQKRARHAWQAVERVRRDIPESQQKDYAREAKRLPVRILTSGLGHALAFLKAKGKQEVLSDLDDWILKQRKLPASPQQAGDLTEAITLGDSLFLQLATDEALAYLQWLTRFAEAEFGRGED